MIKSAERRKHDVDKFSYTRRFHAGRNRSCGFEHSYPLIIKKQRIKKEEKIMNPASIMIDMMKEAQRITGGASGSW